MLRRSIYFYLIFLVCACSNSYNEKADKAQDEYVLLHGINISCVKGQQDFIDELQNAIYNIKEDNNFKVDINELTNLMDTAKVLNDSRITMIKSVVEYDNEIQFKNKSLHDAMLFDSAYNNEFKNAIDILASNNANKFQTIMATLLPRLKKIKEAQMVTENAKNDMQTKYNIHWDEKTEQ